MSGQRIDPYPSFHLKSLLNLILQKFKIALNPPYADLNFVPSFLVFLIDGKIVVLSSGDEVR